MRSSAHKVVLLIRAEYGARYDLADALTRHGYETWSAPDGATALRRLRNELARPDLVVVDWTIPADGASFLARHASDARLCFAPVVVLSDLAQMRAIPSARVAALMAKPVRTRTLLEVIARLIAMPPRLDVVDFDVLADTGRTVRSSMPAALVEMVEENGGQTVRTPDATVRIRRPPSASD